MTPLRLAWLHLRRRAFSSATTLIAMALSGACAALLLHLYLTSSQRFSHLGKGGDFIVGAKADGLDLLLGALNLEADHAEFIPMKLMAALTSRLPVAFEDGTVAPTQFIRGIIPLTFLGKISGYPLIATTETFLKRPRADEALDLREGRWAEGLDEVVAGYQCAKRLNLTPGKTVEVSSSENQKQALTVVGVLNETESAWDRGLYTNLESGKRALGMRDLARQSIWKNEVLNYMLVYLVEPNDPTLRKAELNALEDLINRRTVAQLISIKRQTLRLREITGTQRSMGFAMIGLMLLLGAISILALMVTRFEGMEAQIGVLRAIGYSSREVRAWLVSEGVLLAVGAIASGILLEAVTFPFAIRALGESIPPAAWWQTLPVWMAVFAASLFSAWYTLKRLSLNNVHRALQEL